MLKPRSAQNESEEGSKGEKEREREKASYLHVFSEHCFPSLPFIYRKAELGYFCVDMTRVVISPLGFRRSIHSGESELVLFLRGTKRTGRFCGSEGNLRGIACFPHKRNLGNERLVADVDPHRGNSKPEPGLSL